MNLRDKIRIIEGFPKEGISFKDITTLISDGAAYHQCIDELCKALEEKNVDLIVAPEARGFIFGCPVASKLRIGFAPVRKPGKLPFETKTASYELEYGQDTVEIHSDAIKKGYRVAIIDDLLATGGTVGAIAKLVEEMGGEIVSINFVIELTDLKGRDKLKQYKVDSLIKYDI
ncbi:adenine phosphoribosyltransferase [Hathewaya proteolytica DSM 3090]|uniref:Adenine phosphoribosyltransferase n=1 Tax=Hathewaya proteolytica DSM 3090 TaxID=1121331 RepID=A0A1M6P849_9CLOT|nr:adenine phosphoribosyltransferase [Hathewaya proteolytica]SHK04114.1 adenine phosphoribosyltransferase [Hathewaya proteolytica DSM 3090]